MKIRLSAILWAVLFLGGVFGLYMVKYKVHALRQEVAVTEKQLSEEKHNLHVLTAEWAFLNRPERLRALSEKYLNVKPIRGQQIADFVSLPVAGKSSDVASRQNPHSAGSIKLVSGGGGSAGEDEFSDE